MPGLLDLLKALPEDQREDPVVRAKVEEVWRRLRAERTRQGDSMAGMASVTDWPRADQDVVSVASSGAWLVTARR